MLDIIYVLMSVYLRVVEYSLDTYYVYIIMGKGFPFCKNIPYFSFCIVYISNALRYTTI